MSSHGGHEADLFAYLRERSERDPRRALRAVLHDGFEIRFVADETRVLRLKRGEPFAYRLAYRRFEIAVSAAVKLFFDLGIALPREGRIYRQLRFQYPTYDILSYSPSFTPIDSLLIPFQRPLYISRISLLALFQPDPENLCR